MTLYRERENDNSSIPNVSLNMRSIKYPVSTRTIVKNVTDCTGEGIAFSIMVLNAQDKRPKELDMAVFIVKGTGGDEG